MFEIARRVKSEALPKNLDAIDAVSQSDGPKCKLSKQVAVMYACFSWDRGSPSGKTSPWRRFMFCSRREPGNSMRVQQRDSRCGVDH